MSDLRPAAGGRPSISVPEGWGLEGLAQNMHGSLAISLTWHWPRPVTGVPGEVVALWQLEGEGSQVPAEACAPQVSLRNESI